MGIRCVSVFNSPDGAHLRYDEPGTMHPMQRWVMFAPAQLAGYKYDQIGQLRRRSVRVIVVRDDPRLADPTPPSPPPGWIERMRHHRRIDGVWSRILDDGTLEMRDPNDGQSSDPAHKSRYQYRAEEDGYAKRHLPPESVGDAWQDIGVPEWERCEPGGLVRELLELMYDEHYA
jgi:hypothetical protein